MSKRTDTGHEHAKYNKGNVQLFFERHRGKAFIQALVNRFKFSSKIVIYLVSKYDFKCTKQSIWNYMNSHNISCQRIGGIAETGGMMHNKLNYAKRNREKNVNKWIATQGGIKFMRNMLVMFPDGHGLTRHLWQDYNYPGTDAGIKKYLKEHGIDLVDHERKT